MEQFIVNMLPYEIWGAVAQALLWGLVITAVIQALVKFGLAENNASTRYAVWFTTLLTVAALPVAFLLRSPLPQAFAGAVRQEANRELGLALSPAAVETAQHPRMFVVPIDAEPATVFLVLAGALAALLTFRLAFSYMHVRRLKRHVIDTPPEAAARFERWLEQCPSSPSTRMLVSQRAKSPMAVGYFNPAIIVPESLLLRLTSEEFDHLGLHELAHICRGDHWTHLVQRIVQAGFFFNPAVHWICSRLDLERELACDDQVAELCGQPKRYARSLARILELAPWRSGPILASGTAFGRRQIVKRIETLVDAARNVTTRVSSLTVVVIVMCLFGAVSQLLQMPAVVAFERAFSDNHQRHRWTDHNRTLEFDSAGEVQFAPLEPAVQSISPNGFVRLRESNGRGTREVEYVPAADGAIQTRYLIDGHETKLDATGQSWASALLLQVIRQTGINAEERAAAILEKSGVQGVLEEIDRIDGDHAKRRYLQTLLEQGSKLSPEDQRRTLQRVARLQSDHEKAKTLIESSARLTDDNVRSGWFDAAGTLHSDHDRRRTLEHALSQYPDNVDVLQRVARSAQDIDSDHERKELLRNPALADAVVRPQATALVREYLTAAGRIRSSNDKKEVLTTLLDRSPSDPATLQQIVRVAGTIESDHDRAEVLKHVVSTDVPADAVVADLLLTAEKMGGDQEKANVLIRLASGPYTPDYVRAARSIGSDHEKQRVIRAMIERGNSVEAAQNAVSLTGSLGSDHDKAELLQLVATRFRDNPEIQQQVRRAADKIGSDSDYRRVMSKLSGD